MERIPLSQTALPNAINRECRADGEIRLFRTAYGYSLMEGALSASRFFNDILTAILNATAENLVETNYAYSRTTSLPIQ